MVPEDIGLDLNSAYDWNAVTVPQVYRMHPFPCLC